MDNDISITAHPIRIIPIGLGSRIEGDLKRRIIEKTNSYERDHFSAHDRLLMPGCFVAGKVKDGFRFRIFENGMCVILMEEPEMVLNGLRFSMKYCLDRKEKHKMIKDWDHPMSDLIWELVNDLIDTVYQWKIENTKESKKQDKGKPTISYTMTLSFLKMEGCEDINEIFDVPDMKRNIIAMLDPAVLSLEDYQEFDSLTQEETEEKFMDIDLDVNVTDYEKRTHLCTFMSWSSVIVFGNYSEKDVRDYMCLEAALQSYWRQIELIDEEMPEDIRTIKERKIFAADLQRSANEVEMLIEKVSNVRFSDFPSRYVDIQEGLVRTSGLINNARKYVRRATALSNMIQLENQQRQNRYALTSELLLLAIALMQILPAINSIRTGTSEWVDDVILFSIFIIAAIVLRMRNRMY